MKDDDKVKVHREPQLERGRGESERAEAQGDLRLATAADSDEVLG
jgi:hypothetical protein